MVNFCGKSAKRGRLGKLCGTALLIFSVFSSLAPAWASNCYGVTIKVLTMSPTIGATAHLVQVTNACNVIAAECSLNRAYIDFADVELFETALAAQLKGMSITIAYAPGYPAKGGPPHGNTPCKLYAIWS